MDRELTLVLMSDTHMYHDAHPVPDGDILLHAGDLTHRGRPGNIRRCDDWLGTLPHRHRVIIAGNHDFLFERDPPAARALITHATYLEDSETTAEGLRIWGTPWQPWFYDWAFNLETEAELAEKWALIPDGIDVLVSHSPPYGIGDLCHDGDRPGCRALLRRVLEVRPKLHVFGHIHENRGWWRLGDTLFVNAANGYGGEYPAIVVKWGRDGPRVVSDTPRIDRPIRPPRT